MQTFSDAKSCKVIVLKDTRIENSETADIHLDLSGDTHIQNSETDDIHLDLSGHFALQTLALNFDNQCDMTVTLGNITQLRIISLSEVRLIKERESRDIHFDFSVCPHLKHLVLNFARSSCEMKVSLGDIRGLQSVYLKGVCMPKADVDGILKCLQSQTKLLSIRLFNLSTEDLILNLERSEDLTELFLEDMKLSNVKLSEKARPNTLHLKNVTMTSQEVWKVFFEMPQLQKLKSLYVWSLSIGDSILHLNCDELEHLELKNVTMTSPECWQEFFEMSQLQKLKVLRLYSLSIGDSILHLNCDALSWLITDDVIMGGWTVSPNTAPRRVVLSFIIIPDSTDWQSFLQPLITNKLMNLELGGVDIGDMVWDELFTEGYFPEWFNLSNVKMTVKSYIHLQVVMKRPNRYSRKREVHEASVVNDTVVEVRASLRILFLVIIRAKS